MPQYAPESPTTAELATLYPFEENARLRVVYTRASLADALDNGFVACIGASAMTPALGFVNHEGDMLAQLQTENPGLVTVHSSPVWKHRPNTNETWWGLETDPNTVEMAYSTLVRRAIATANVAIEIGHAPHLTRYANLLTAAWIGDGRADNAELIHVAADYDRTLPIMVENDASGNLDLGIQNVRTIIERRGEEGAPGILMYSGGEEARTPEEWEDGCRRAMERTLGRVIINVANNAEMAHHPFGEWRKSISGQMAALHHLLDIAVQHGEIPAGVLIEASDAMTWMDPHMRFEDAVEGALSLYQLRMRQISARGL